jgi:hypothetical protein
VSNVRLCASTFLVFGLTAVGLSLIGCVVVPPKDGLARVRVGDVVKRIKCDLAEVIFTKAQERTPDGKTPFVFLANWAAKIHLTIAVDDSAALNPGATITNPIDKTVATPLIPATTEFFSLGLGAGITTEAIRTEDIEFLVSFSDLIKEFQKPSKRELYNGCQFENGLLLESDLGLAQLVNSALEPIKTGVLYQGNNVGPPGTGAVPIPSNQLENIAQQLRDLRSASAGLPRPSPDQSISDLANSLRATSQANKLITKFQIPNDLLSKSENQLKGENKSQPSEVAIVKAILTYSADATTEETRTQAIINNIVKPLYAIASASVDPACLTKITQSQFQAITWSAKVSINVINVDNATDENQARAALEDVKAARDKVIDFATKMVSEIAACSAVTKPPRPRGPPQYDPIDLISETVNFFVTTNINVTPSWKLVKVTAPLAPTFFSGSRKDTNTVILAMGRPAPAPNGGITSSLAMNNQILAAILSQAITTQRLGP